MLIIGILAAVALPQYTKAVEKSRTSEAVTLLGDILTGERIYQLANGNYTNDLTKLDITMPGLETSSEATSTFDTKNYTITVKNADKASTAIVEAKRLNGPAGQYTLTFTLDNNGVITRYCNDASGNTAICNSIRGTEWASGEYSE